MTTDVVRPLIAVGVDGSAESAKATAWAANYARVTGGTLDLVIAWARPVSYGLPLVVGGYNPEAEARGVVEKAAADIDLPVERIRLAVENGAAPTALLAHAAKERTAYWAHQTGARIGQRVSHSIRSKKNSGTRAVASS